MENTTPEYTIEQRRDFPALHGRTVTQMHTNICSVYGHATHLSDGVDRGMCPRCGEVKPGFGGGSSQRVEVERLSRQAEEIPQLLNEVSARQVPGFAHNPASYLVLREFSGVKVDFEEDVDAQLPSPVPGVLIEGARFVESDGFHGVELTVWGRGEMQLITLSQNAPVVVFAVADSSL